MMVPKFLAYPLEICKLEVDFAKTTTFFVNCFFLSSVSISLRKFELGVVSPCGGPSQRFFLAPLLHTKSSPIKLANTKSKYVIFHCGWSRYLCFCTRFEVLVNFLDQSKPDTLAFRGAVWFARYGFRDFVKNLEIYFAVILILNGKKTIFSICTPNLYE